MEQVLSHSLAIYLMITWMEEKKDLKPQEPVSYKVLWHQIMMSLSTWSEVQTLTQILIVSICVNCML